MKNKPTNEVLTPKHRRYCAKSNMSCAVLHTDGMCPDVRDCEGCKAEREVSSTASSEHETSKQATPAPAAALLDKILKLLDEAEGVSKNTDGLADDKYIAHREALTEGIQALLLQSNTEAQTNAVAWAVGVVDDIHIIENRSLVGDTDKLYKGVKNVIRDRYKAMVGVDPAPNYPVKAELKKGQM